MATNYNSGESSAKSSQDPVDVLINQMESSTSLGDYPGYKTHPRFDDFKNVGKIAMIQKERREERIQHQRNKRNEIHNRQRKLFEDEDDEDACNTDENFEMESQTSHNSFRLNNVDKRYKGQLMLSEWLIDIPNELQGQWTMVACPVGKRCLVVAKDGWTTVYNKYGVRLDSFRSGLAGGSPGPSRGKMTILDCVRYDKPKNKFYILDVIFANGMEFCQESAIARLSQIPALENEITISTKQARIKKANHFIAPPRCDCTPEAMADLMSRPLPFIVDGLLFYNNEGWYSPGYSPLVGWLKPWMLPEVLNVSVHEMYANNSENTLSVEAYISDYNQIHNHKYINGRRAWEQEVVNANENENYEDT